jgi:hypothetical protein
VGKGQRGGAGAGRGVGRQISGVRVERQGLLGNFVFTVEGGGLRLISSPAQPGISPRTVRKRTRGR